VTVQTSTGSDLSKERLDTSTPAFEVALNGIGLTSDVVALIAGVEVTQESNGTDHCALTVLNLFPEFRFTHKKPYFKLGDILTVKLGYVDALDPVFDGDLTVLQPSFSSGEPSTLSVEGHSRLHRLRLGTRTRTFQGYTDKVIAETIAHEVGLTPEADQTKPEHPYVIQRNQSDYDFLLERARRIGFEVLVVGKTLYFRKPPDEGIRELKLSWAAGDAGGQLTVLHGFEATFDGTKPVTKVEVPGWDATTGKAIKAVVEAGSKGVAPSTDASKAFGARREMVVTGASVDSKEEATRIAQAYFDAQALRTLTATGTALGNPLIRPGKVVRIDGLGPLFSGDYLITRATHRLDHRGYETSFVVRRGKTAS
jgi:phage protein D